MTTYGLIGYPLTHSFSKKFFTEKFKEENVNCVFELFPLEKISDFKYLLQSRPDIQGIAVTIPYKREVINYLDELSADAKNIGAVNCIQFKNGKLVGHNTDVTGFEKSFLPLLKPWHKQALILGTGGAAQAVKFVLEKYNIPYLSVSRGELKNERIISYKSISAEIINSYPVIINTTPVGMFPRPENKPTLPYISIGKDNYLYDLVYNPAETLFLQESIKRGAIIKNGLEMLTLQAEENWKIWNS